MSPAIRRTSLDDSHPPGGGGLNDFLFRKFEGFSAHNHRIEALERFVEEGLVLGRAEGGSPFVVPGDAAVDALCDDDCGVYHDLQFDTGSFVASMLKTT